MVTNTAYPVGAYPLSSCGLQILPKRTRFYWIWFYPQMCDNDHDDHFVTYPCFIMCYPCITWLLCMYLHFGGWWKINKNYISCSYRFAVGIVWSVARETSQRVQMHGYVSDGSTEPTAPGRPPMVGTWTHNDRSRGTRESAVNVRFTRPVVPIRHVSTWDSPVSLYLSAGLLDRLSPSPVHQDVGWKRNITGLNFMYCCCCLFIIVTCSRAWIHKHWDKWIAYGTQPHRGLQVTSKQVLNFTMWTERYIHFLLITTDIF